MTDLWSALGILGRGGHYLGIFLLVGAAVARTAVLPVAERRWQIPPSAGGMLRNRATWLGVLGGLLIVLAGFLRGYVQLTTLGEPGEPVDWSLAGYVLQETTWGQGWMAQMLAGLLGAAAHLFGTLRTPLTRFLPAFGSSLIVFAAPLTGHAAGSAEAGSVGYPVDLLHVLGGGSWIGTLLVLALAGFWSGLGLNQEDRARTVAGLVHAFSPVALVAGATTIGAGLILSFQYIGWSPSAWIGTAYGQTLLVKLLLVGGVAAAGAWNWRVLRPRLGSDAGTRALRRATAVELGLSLALLLVTALLVSLPMPGDME